jgi:hypothetical protein
MPPLIPLPPPEGDIAPYPNEILTLGNNRWLNLLGHIISEPFGVAVELQDNTRRYWEGRAAVAGSTLAELMETRTA